MSAELEGEIIDIIIEFHELGDLSHSVRKLGKSLFCNVWQNDGKVIQVIHKGKIGYIQDFRDPTRIFYSGQNNKDWNHYP